MARSKWNPQMQYAIKFFMARRVFEAEAALYQDSATPLGKFLPEVCSAVTACLRSDVQLHSAQAHGVLLSPPCMYTVKVSNMVLKLVSSFLYNVDKLRDAFSPMHASMPWSHEVVWPPGPYFLPGMEHCGAQQHHSSASAVWEN